MEAKRVADLTVEELQSIILETKRVSDLTVGELKAIIAEVVDRRLINWLNTANQKSYIVRPATTKEEQTQGNLAEIKSFQKLLEEGKAEGRELREILFQDFLSKAPIKSSAVLPARTKEEQMQRNLATIEWLDKWAEEGDEEEQRETFEYLRKALDEDRLSSQRFLFQKQ
jgi:type II secretory pathway component PulM